MLLKHRRTEEHSYLVVLDFGIARMLENDGTTTMTAAADLVSTPAYMSPEQIAGGLDNDGMRRDIGRRSDLYSTGVVLYQLLTGSLPFRGTTMAILAAHLTSPPLPMKEANPAVTVPPEVERAIMQCLEKDPRNRPRSAAELARLIHRGETWPEASAPSALARFTGSDPWCVLCLDCFTAPRPTRLRQDLPRKTSSRRQKPRTSRRPTNRRFLGRASDRVDIRNR